jgi:hypothetical protein
LLWIIFTIGRTSGRRPKTFTRAVAFGEKTRGIGKV